MLRYGRQVGSHVSAAEQRRGNACWAQGWCLRVHACLESIPLYILSQPCTLQKSSRVLWPHLTEHVHACSMNMKE